MSHHDCDARGCPCTFGEHMDAMYGAVPCPKCLRCDRHDSSPLIFRKFLRIVCSRCGETWWTFRGYRAHLT